MISRTPDNQSESDQRTPASPWPNAKLIEIERAKAQDIASIHALLEANRLPLDGFDEHIGSTLVARERGDGAAGEISGSATLELYGPYALLRSVAVAEKHRGCGLGQQLTTAALDLARQQGARTIFLLTETAAGFFPRFGFEPVSRETVPAEVLQSVEFTTACPASAVVLRLDLAPTARQE